MDRAEKILREQLKIDKSFGFGKLMWELHKNTLKKCMQIYVEEQLLLHNVSQQRELLLQAYKDGFQAAVDSLVGANEVVKNKTLQ